ncbi:L-glutaminase [Tindallia magadiensis]|uniref:Glutaminase n=1 Tax=Tindallia magadiensis TaxID=69895 RepID=A0A1I3AMZ5_9FIRM|nr:glutaminase A [Tindallia magadiensis]SFH51410.1 L-glutaminase [Tindallia magadiensis]
MMQNILEKILEDHRHWTKEGALATYIPELSKQKIDALGIYVHEINGEVYKAGEWNTPFTIQSISKIISFICVLQDNSIDTLYKKITVAPSSDGFNSIVNLETKNEHRPLNPMINSGAIACIELVSGNTLEEKYERILNMIRSLSNNPYIKVNESVYLSEKETGDRNRALAYFMKSTGTIETNVEELLDAYFRLCSIEVTCEDIASIAVVLANDGKSIIDGRELISKKICKTVKAVMTTCGLYDGSGEYAVSVGVPSKSGVGGGILAVSPGKMGIGVFGPSLDAKGNSIAGVKVLESLAKKLDLSIF